MGNSTTQEKCIVPGWYSFSSLPNRLRNPFNALQVIAQVSATKNSRSPASACIRPPSSASQASLKFLATGDQSLPSLSTRNQTRPLAPKSCLTNSVNSSIRFREKLGPLLDLAFSPGPAPGLAASRNTRNSHCAASSVQSINSMPKRRSGASCP
jgi:hypothetical protein